MAISKRLRFEVLRRDNHTCRYCGRSAPEVKLTVDHVTPKALGGRDEPANLVTACAECNSGKSATPPDAPLVDDVKQDALRWTRAMEFARQITAQKREHRDAAREEFVYAWDAWTYPAGDERATIPLPPNWATSVDAFVDHGLDLDDLVEAIRVAMTAHKLTHDRRFRYFCGVAWRMIGQRQDIARAAIESSSVEETFDRLAEMGF